MTSLSTLTKRNQTTLPKAVIDALGLKPADQLIYEIEDDHVVLRARTGRLADLLNDSPPVPPPRRPFNQKRIDAAIGGHMAEEDARIRSGWHGSKSPGVPPPRAR